MSRTLWLVRHGHRLDFLHPEWFNLAKYRYDPPLSDLGQEQSKVLATVLETVGIRHIFSSPFLRCLQTAYPIARKLDLLIKVEASLGEWLNIEWLSESPTLYSETLLKPFYPSIDRRYTSHLFPQYPETLEQVQRRKMEIIDQLLKNFSGDLLLVGHSITITGVINALIKEQPEISTSFGCLIKLDLGIERINAI
jgi:broad specificity phosphatase PhoE